MNVNAAEEESKNAKMLLQSLQTESADMVRNPHIEELLGNHLTQVVFDEHHQKRNVWQFSSHT